MPPLLVQNTLVEVLVPGWNHYRRLRCCAQPMGTPTVHGKHVPVYSYRITELYARNIYRTVDVERLGYRDP